MADKTIYIIFSVINAFMWIIAIDWMRRTSRNYMNFLTALMKDIRHVSDVITADEQEVARAIQRSDEMIARCEEYYHKTFKKFNEMSEINVSAAGQFIAQISDIILTGENKGKISNETENRE